MHSLPGKQKQIDRLNALTLVLPSCTYSMLQPRRRFMSPSFSEVKYIFLSHLDEDLLLFLLCEVLLVRVDDVLGRNLGPSLNLHETVLNSSLNVNWLLLPA
jgi:hypothetical protein